MKPPRHGLSWQAAVEIVCCELEEYAVHRDAGRSVLETGLAMGIFRETAAQYERTISNLLAVLKEGTTPAGTGAAATRHVNGARVMTKSTESTRRPWETNVGDVIVRHPDHPEQVIEAKITKPYRYDGYTTWLDYRMPDGSEGVFVFGPGQLVTLRGVTYTVQALLTAPEREQAYEGLSEDDFGVLISHVRDQFPEVFDSAMAALGRTKARLAVVPKAGA